MKTLLSEDEVPDMLLIITIIIMFIASTMELQKQLIPSAAINQP
jgi:hypothetical protein